MARKKVAANAPGLKVAYSHDGPLIRPGRGKIARERAAPGWYVYVRDRVSGRELEWVALLVFGPVGFVRKLDASRAALALTTAGLNTADALKDALLEEVRKIACEFLQW